MANVQLQARGLWKIRAAMRVLVVLAHLRIVTPDQAERFMQRYTERSLRVVAVPA